MQSSLFPFFKPFLPCSSLVLSMIWALVKGLEAARVTLWNGPLHEIAEGAVNSLWSLSVFRESRSQIFVCQEILPFVFIPCHRIRECVGVGRGLKTHLVPPPAMGTFYLPSGDRLLSPIWGPVEHTAQVQETLGIEVLNCRAQHKHPKAGSLPPHHPISWSPQHTPLCKVWAQVSRLFLPQALDRIWEQSC